LKLPWLIGAKDTFVDVLFYSSIWTFLLPFESFGQRARTLYTFYLTHFTCIWLHRLLALNSKLSGSWRMQYVLDKSDLIWIDTTKSGWMARGKSSCRSELSSMVQSLR
jgi:hypothetical protein